MTSHKMSKLDLLSQTPDLAPGKLNHVPYLLRIFIFLAQMFVHRNRTLASECLNLDESIQAKSCRLVLHKTLLCSQLGGGEKKNHNVVMNVICCCVNCLGIIAI